MENKDFIPNEGEVADENLDLVSGGISDNPEDALGKRYMEVRFEQLDINMPIFARPLLLELNAYTGRVLFIEKQKRMVTLHCSNGVHRIAANDYKFFLVVPFN